MKIRFCFQLTEQIMMIPSVSRPSFLALMLALIAIGAFPIQSHAAYEYEKFVGEYMGEGVSQSDGELTKRDFSVTITPKGQNFVVTWVSVTRNDDGTLKRKSYTVQFKPKGRSGLYGSAMRSDMFGNQVPLDPLNGEPYVWARIEGDTLFVYAMLITEDGGYEMQTYERTLTPVGMNLTYSRVRDGKMMRTVEGTLKRVK